MAATVTALFKTEVDLIYNPLALRHQFDIEDATFIIELSSNAFLKVVNK